MRTAGEKNYRNSGLAIIEILVVGLGKILQKSKVNLNVQVI
jgi:hypothetical protein